MPLLMGNNFELSSIKPCCPDPYLGTSPGDRQNFRKCALLDLAGRALRIEATRSTEKNARSPIASWISSRASSTLFNSLTFVLFFAVAVTAYWSYRVQPCSRLRIG